MPDKIPVSPKTHQNRFWQRYTSYRFAQNEHSAPLAAAEIPRAAQAMPLAFEKQGDTFVLVGVLSLSPNRNLFVNPDGKWVGPYVPSFFRGHPFLLERMKNKQDQPVLYVDEGSGLISETTGEPFFNDNGELAGPVKDILNFLTQVHQNRRATDAAVAALAGAGLMTRWTVKDQDGRERSIANGLYKVNEAGLNALDDQAFLKLRKSRSLPLAYAQLLSMGNIGLLARMAERNVPAPAAGPKDVGGMVLDDDMIRFE
jgi:hypothetical protein